MAAPTGLEELQDLLAAHLGQLIERRLCGLDEVVDLVSSWELEVTSTAG